MATGGFSYQSTGSTGDGYRFARELGLKVTDIAPSLVPLKTKEDYVPKLQGLSLKNTGLTIKNGKKVLYEDFGEMMFTHSCDCEGEGFDKVNEVLAFFSGDVVDFLLCGNSTQFQHYRSQR